MTGRPSLVVVSGPPGSGKTTLAHELARLIGCPAICRDEVKEGMAHPIPGYRPSADDPLPLRTLAVFFEVIEVLLRAGVTVVAESAFQDRLWRPGLERLAPLCDIRVVHCVVDGSTAYERRLARAGTDPLRVIHEPPGGFPPREVAVAGHDGFEPIALDVPSIRVETGDGYRPGLEEVVAWLRGWCERQALSRRLPRAAPELPNASVWLCRWDSIRMLPHAVQGAAAIAAALSPSKAASISWATTETSGTRSGSPTMPQ